jgi:hypothetical protein
MIKGRDSMRTNSDILVKNLQTHVTLEDAKRWEDQLKHKGVSSVSLLRSLVIDFLNREESATERAKAVEKKVGGRKE